MKSNQVVSFSESNGVLSFAVAGVDGAVRLCVDELPQEIIHQAVIHGLKQKISDRAAIARDPETGRSATPQEKFDAMQETAKRLASGGPWNAVGGEGGATKRGVLFTALCELFPTRPPNELREWLARKSKSEQAKLRKSEKVAAKIAEIQARNGDAGAGDDMLDELESE